MDYDNRRDVRGRCWGCWRVYVWRRSRMKVGEAHCPNCGEPLVQTACPGGKVPVGCKYERIDVPDTRAIALSRFGTDKVDKHRR